MLFIGLALVANKQRSHFGNLLFAKIRSCYSFELQRYAHLNRDNEENNSSHATCINPFCSPIITPL